MVDPVNWKRLLRHSKALCRNLIGYGCGEIDVVPGQSRCVIELLHGGRVRSGGDLLRWLRERL